MISKGYNPNTSGRMPARQVNVTLTDEMFAVIREMAEQDDRSVSSMARILLLAGLEAINKK